MDSPTQHRLIRLKRLEELLLEFEKIDEAICSGIKKVEEESEIVERRLLVFKKRKVDYEKLDKEKVIEISKLFDRLIQDENMILAEYKEILGNESEFDGTDRKMVNYLKKDIHNIFAIVKGAKMLIDEMQQFIGEFRPKELAETFGELNHLFENLRKFTREMLHYAEHWRVDIGEKPYVDVKKVIHSSIYKRDMSKNPELKKHIIECEKKIESWPEYVEKLHGKLKSGKFEGSRHARLPNAFRIIYLYDMKNGILTYQRIVSHQDMDKSF